MEEPAFTDGRPVALTVAGSDSSAGAGLQADLKTFASLHVYGLSAITCAVSEVPGTVNRIEALPPEFLRDQVALLSASFPVAAIKTGMLYSREHILNLVAALDDASYDGALVVDPVMVATSGDPLIQDDAVEAYESLLFPKADLITPNLDEAGALLGRDLKNIDDVTAAAVELERRCGSAVLVKGGHLGGDDATDVLSHGDGQTELFHAQAISGVVTHGTGCTFSAAITAHLARGLSLRESIRESKTFISRAIRTAFRWNSPKGDFHALNTG